MLAAGEHDVPEDATVGVLVVAGRVEVEPNGGARESGGRVVGRVRAVGCVVSGVSTPVSRMVKRAPSSRTLMVSPSITRSTWAGSVCARTGASASHVRTARARRTTGCDTPLAWRAVESFDVPCVAPCVVAPDVRGFFHGAPAVGARHVDHHRDAVDHAPARGPAKSPVRSASLDTQQLGRHVLDAIVGQTLDLSRSATPKNAIS